MALIRYESAIFLCSAASALPVLTRSINITEKVKCEGAPGSLSHFIFILMEE